MPNLRGSGYPLGRSVDAVKHPRTGNNRSGWASVRRTKTTATQRRLLAGLTAGFALLAFTETAQAQEILLTGPLAGAPAVRQLRLYREGRFEAEGSDLYICAIGGGGEPRAQQIQHSIGGVSRILAAA